MEDGAAAGRHRVDGEHRHAEPGARDLGLEIAFEAAVIEGDVGRGAAHVEADDAIEPGGGRGARRAVDAAGGTGEDRVLAVELGRFDQAAIRLHEVEARAAERLRHPCYVTAENGRDVGIDQRRLPTRHDAEQGGDGVAYRDMGETGLAGEGGEPLLVPRMAPGMHAHDGAGLEPFGAGRGEDAARFFLVEGGDLAPLGIDPPVDLHHPGEEGGGAADLEGEEVGPRLVADDEHVGEAAIDHEQHLGPLAFEERVGRDRGAHFHRLDHPLGQGCLEWQAEQRLDPGDGRIAVAAGVFGEELEGEELALGRAGDEVGEGAAAVNPELPTGPKGGCVFFHERFLTNHW